MNTRSHCLAVLAVAMLPAGSPAQWEQVNIGLTKYHFTRNESIVAGTSPYTPVYRSLADTPAAWVPVGTPGFIPYGTYSGWWNVSFDNGISGTVWERDLSHPLPSVGDFGVIGSFLFCGTSRNAFMTRDTGAHWTQINSDWRSPLSDYWTVYKFQVSGTGVYALAADHPYVSRDSGGTWQWVGPQEFNIETLDATNKCLYVSRSGGVHLRSTNGGTSWDTITCPGTLAIFDTILFVQHSSGQIDASFDNGTNWKTMVPGLPPPGRAWSFVAAGNYLLDLEGSDSLNISVIRRLWKDSTLVVMRDAIFSPNFPSGLTTGSIRTSGTNAIMDYGGTYFSTNSGGTWAPLSVPADVPSAPAFAVIGKYLFVAGTGVWRKSLDVAASAAHPGGVPALATLSQNYPNPFNPSTTIKYELPKTLHVSLTVYDLLGREVSVLVHERKDAGVHEVKFDGSSLASGVYFYRLQAGSYVNTKKLLILR